MAIPKPSRHLIFELNDNFEIKMSPVTFGLCLAGMAAATLVIPYVGLFTVPTYLAVLFAFVSDKVQYVLADEGTYLFEEE